MANVAHKNLAGTDLHEPKGAAGASDGEVYIADGNGTGAWAAKGPLVAIVRQTETDGTNGTQPTALTWTATKINTEEQDPESIVSLSSNQFTLGAGTYHIRAWQAFRSISSAVGARVRIRNATDGTTLITGATLNLNNGGGGSGDTRTMYAHVEGVTTISSSKAFELQHITNNTSLKPQHDHMTQGVEVYAEVVITKIK